MTYYSRDNNHHPGNTPGGGNNTSNNSRYPPTRGPPGSSHPPPPTTNAYHHRTNNNNNNNNNITHPNPSPYSAPHGPPGPRYQHGSRGSSSSYYPPRPSASSTPSSVAGAYPPPPSRYQQGPLPSTNRPIHTQSHTGPGSHGGRGGSSYYPTSASSSSAVTSSYRTSAYNAQQRNTTVAPVAHPSSAHRMEIDSRVNKLVQEFKKRGHFDLMRKTFLEEFQNSSIGERFTSAVTNFWKSNMKVTSKDDIYNVRFRNACMTQLERSEEYRRIKEDARRGVIDSDSTISRIEDALKKVWEAMTNGDEPSVDESSSSSVVQKKEDALESSTSETVAESESKDALKKADTKTKTTSAILATLFESEFEAVVVPAAPSPNSVNMNKRLREENNVLDGAIATKGDLDAGIKKRKVVSKDEDVSISEGVSMSIGESGSVVEEKKSEQASEKKNVEETSNIVAKKSVEPAQKKDTKPTEKSSNTGNRGDRKKELDFTSSSEEEEEKEKEKEKKTLKKGAKTEAKQTDESAKETEKTVKNKVQPEKKTTAASTLNMSDSSSEDERAKRPVGKKATVEKAKPVSGAATKGKGGKGRRKAAEPKVVGAYNLSSSSEDENKTDGRDLKKGRAATKRDADSDNESTSQSTKQSATKKTFPNSDSSSSPPPPPSSSSSSSSEESDYRPTFSNKQYVAAFLPVSPSKSSSPPASPLSDGKPSANSEKTKCYIVRIEKMNAKTGIFTVRDPEADPDEGDQELYQIPKDSLVDFKSNEAVERTRRKLKVGQKVFALYREDPNDEEPSTEFYRAEVVRINKTSVAVRFYDGDTGVVKYDELFIPTVK